MQDAAFFMALGMLTLVMVFGKKLPPQVTYGAFVLGLLGMVIVAIVKTW